MRTQNHLPPAHHPLPALLQARGWLHARTNCPCKGKEYHSVYRRGEAMLWLWWRLETYYLNTELSGGLKGNLEEIEEVLVQ